MLATMNLPSGRPSTAGASAGSVATSPGSVPLSGVSNFSDIIGTTHTPSISRAGASSGSTSAIPLADVARREAATDEDDAVTVPTARATTTSAQPVGAGATATTPSRSGASTRSSSSVIGSANAYDAPTDVTRREAATDDGDATTASVDSVVQPQQGSESYEVSSAEFVNGDGTCVTQVAGITDDRNAFSGGNGSGGSGSGTGSSSNSGERVLGRPTRLPPVPSPPVADEMVDHRADFKTQEIASPDTIGETMRTTSQQD